MVMFSSVILLIITGMPLKFPGFVLSRFVINFWGGIQNSTLVHRIGAGMLIYFMVHHLFYTILSRDGRRDFVLLLPKPQDAKDIATSGTSWGRTPKSRGSAGSATSRSSTTGPSTGDASS
jgi:hypothetical protein